MSPSFYPQYPDPILLILNKNTLGLDFNPPRIITVTRTYKLILSLLLVCRLCWKSLGFIIDLSTLRVILLTVTCRGLRQVGKVAQCNFNNIDKLERGVLFCPPPPWCKGSCTHPHGLQGYPNLRMHRYQHVASMRNMFISDGKSPIHAHHHCSLCW